MVLAVWWVLMLATMASDAHYADYSEAKMPDYGSALDYDGPRDSPPATTPDTADYHQHLKDPPASLEYKYEEDRGGKHNKQMINKEYPQEWQQSFRKHKQESDDENQQTLDSYGSDDSAANFEPKSRGSRHRTRLKSKNPGSENSAAHLNKYAVRYSRKRKDDINYIERKDNSDELRDEFEDDKGNDFDEDEIKVQNNHNHRHTTVKIVRRKPRDRSIGPEPVSDEEVHIRSLRKRPSKDETRSQYRRQNDEIRAKSRPRYKENDDYSEYYDMKRVQNVKEQLVKEERTEAYKTTTTMWLYPRRKQPEAMAHTWQRKRSNDGLGELRRLMNPDGSVENDGEIENYDTETNTFSYDEIVTDAYYGENTGLPERRAMVSEVPKPVSTETTQIITNTTTMTTTTKMPTTTIIIVVPNQTYNDDNKVAEIPTTTEMSLAEKSRLSILKKALRKEMSKGDMTKKPPVLLQVTNALHTLVMVEPPTKMQSWQLVSVVNKDTSDNILKVKRLMRKNLVAKAKDIHELSDNWDESICDYIDMSLLEPKKSAASINNVQMSPIFFHFIAIVLLL